MQLCMGISSNPEKMVDIEISSINDKLEYYSYR